MNLWKLIGVTAGALVACVLVVGAMAQEDRTKKDSQAAPAQPAGAEKKQEAVASKGNAAKGKEVFEADCAVCHEAESDAVRVGPGLKGLYKKPPHKLADGKEHRHTEAAMRELIEKGTGSMPPMGAVLSPQQMEDVLAYLHTL